MRKQASIPEIVNQVADFAQNAHLGTMAGTWIAGDSILAGLRHLGQKNSPELFTTAYEYGKQGKQVNLHTKNLMHTVLGRQSIRSLEEGRKLGQYMARRGFSPKEEEHYLRQLHAAGRQRVYSPYGKDLGHMLENNLNDKSVVQRFAAQKPDAVTKKPGAAHMAQDVALASLAPVTDFRLATRPAFRHLDETRAVKALDKSLEGDGKLKQTARGVKNYIS